MLLLYHYFNFRIYLRRGVFVQKAKFIGLLPIIVFLVLFIGVGAFTGDKVTENNNDSYNLFALDDRRGDGVHYLVCYF